MTRPVFAALVCLSLTTSTQRVAAGQAPVGAPPQPAQAGGAGEVRTLHVQGNVHMLVGAGGNIAVQIGDQGVLVVDTGTAAMSDKVLAAIRQLSTKTIRHVINTHLHADHTGGNEAISKAGRQTNGIDPADIIAHENVLARMSAPAGKQAAAPSGAWPINTYFQDEKDLFFNDEAVMLYHAAAGHTDGDSIVFFRRSDVVVAGDIYVTTSYPFIDAQNGGGVQGVINGLNRLLDLCVPKHEQEGGTFVIPGHGRVSDEADVLEYRDMVTIIRDRIQDMVKRGMTLDQVKAAKPTLDYDAQYGSTTGPWTTAMFIEAIYRNLSKK